MCWQLGLIISDPGIKNWVLIQSWRIKRVIIRQLRTTANFRMDDPLTTYKADLIVLDDLMFMALDKPEANLFFHFINKLYEQTSFIITSNKSPEQSVITGAFLDRMVQKSQVVELVGESYRVTHRQTIFKE